jgi:hypothetical protein
MGGPTLIVIEFWLEHSTFAANISLCGTVYDVFEPNEFGSAHINRFTNGCIIALQVFERDATTRGWDNCGRWHLQLHELQR